MVFAKKIKQYQNNMKNLKYILFTLAIISSSCSNDDRQTSDNEVTTKDIYMCGYGSDGDNYTPKYWKNGVATFLTDGTATAITAAGNDVYVAGYQSGNKGNFVAKYWKNGIDVILTNGENFAQTNAITVVDNDVYVTGYENNGGVNVANIGKMVSLYL